MNLAIFDLDNTLLDGDSDHAWGEFLVAKQLVDVEFYQAKNNQFYEQYKSGTLDIYEYQEFVLEHLRPFSMPELGRLHDRFMQEVIGPMITSASLKLLHKHKQQGDYLLIVTATNDFITGPIAKHLQVDDLIATQGEIIDEHYTGKIAGLPSYQHGKVTRLEQWLQQQATTFNNSYFYSDSVSDLPLLEWVDNPVVANGDEKLQAIAKDKKWPTINLRHAKP